jgi:hypothetical protein
MRVILAFLVGLFFTSVAYADNVLIVDPQYSGVASNVSNRLQAAGHTVTTITTAPTILTGYQQVWDLRYATALTSSETTLYQSFITNGGFAYFVTENPGCCMSRNNSVAALVTALGGGSTQIGPGWANNVETNMNTTYMTNGITVNYAAVAAIVNSQGIPLISDGSGAVSGMSWIGRAGALGSGVTGTIVTVADINWLDNSRMVIGSGATTAQQQNVQALDDIIKGIVAGTVAGTISSSGNGAGASNGNTGAPPPPPPVTVVSTAPGTPKVTSTTSDGVTTTTTTTTRGTTTTVTAVTTAPTTYTSSYRDAAVKAFKKIDVTRTTTVVAQTPRTTVNTLTTPVTVVTTTTVPKITTTTTIPVTVTTFSDGTSTSADEAPVVTTSTTNQVTNTPVTTNEVVVVTVRDTIVQTASSDQTASASAGSLKDSIAVRNMNLFLVDPITTKDGGWASPTMAYAKTDGIYKSGGFAFGAQKTIDNNTFGIAGTYGKTKNYNYVNSNSDSDSYGATAYVLNKQKYVWAKGAVGFGVAEYTTTTSLPIFALVNSNRVKTKNYYADLTLYSGIDYNGIRPLAGVTINNSVITSGYENGSPLLSTMPETGSTVEARPYVGVRYDYADTFGIETRVTQSKDFKTVGQVRASVKKEVYKNVYIDATAGVDRGTNYVGALGMVGLKVNF